MRTRNREPQTLGEGTLDRRARILAVRNIDPAAVAAVVDEPEPFSLLDALSAGMPPRYRAAVADHPTVLAWAREVAE
ncbi:ATP-binding protein, partial [Streptomyces sp. NPDC002055]